MCNSKIGYINSNDKNILLSRLVLWRNMSVINIWRSGMVWSGLVWSGMVWYGMVNIYIYL